MKDLNGPDALAIATQNARQEELRLQRVKLLSRTGMVILLWVLLTIVAVTALVVSDIDSAKGIIGGLVFAGFLGTAFLL